MGTVGVDCNLGLDFVKKLSSLVVVNQVSVLVETFAVRVIRQVDRVVAVWQTVSEIFDWAFMDVSPADNNFKQEESVWLAFL